MTNHYHVARNAGIIALTLVAGLFFISFTPLQHATAANDHGTRHVASAIAEVDHDFQAHTDMEAYAALYFGDFTEVQDSFGGTSHYSPDWYLHFVEIEHDGHVALIYHLTSRHGDGHCLVNVWDSANGTWSGWDEIH
jgi:hypothetical protein